jgi:ribosomal protein S18 acetylase RimI-like enzyme
MSVLTDAAWPVGLTVRPARYTAATDGAAPVPDPDDVSAVVALLRACDTAVVGEPDTGAEEIAGMFTGPITDRDATLLVHHGDRLAAFVWIEHDADASETWVDVYVDPEHPDPALYDAGFAHGLRTARLHRDAAGSRADWSLRTGCFVTDAALVAAIERQGFERVRRFWRMSIPTGSPAIPATAPELPSGVTITVVRTDEERRRAYDLRNASFADHWHNVERSYEDWIGFHDADVMDPDGWWLLQVDGVDAAICLMDDSRLELGDGYVRTLGVAREFRGRGLATLLLQRSFVYYRDKGRRAVQLGVDSESPTGANHLYEKVGMRPERVIDAWSLTVGGAADGG